MLLFQPPDPTRYDLRFTLIGIPVRVHPLFWLLTVFLGGASGDLLFLVIWTVVVFVSVVAHEMGHALAMRRYGQPSYVVLYWGGGLTVPDAVRWGSGWAHVTLSPGQEILISLAGPGAGFLLAAFVLAGVAAAGGSILPTALFGVIPFPSAVLPAAGRAATLLVTTLLWVNIFWGVINLLPVFPLDGGNVARRLLIKLDPLDGARKSLWISVITGGLVAVAGLLLFGSIFMALLFGFMAFQSYQSLRGRGGFGG